MVDSGAKNSVISEDLLSGRSTFLIKPSLPYRNIDGSAVGNIVGETSITVRYGGVVLDLNRVVVVKTAVFPLVLGIEWIVRSGANIKGINGKAEVIMPGQEVQQHEQKKIMITKEDEVKTRLMVDDKLASIEEDISEEKFENENVPEGKLVNENLTEENLGGENLSEEKDFLRPLAAMLDDASFAVTVRTTPRQFLKPMRSKRVPAGNWGSFSCRVPDARKNLWMVSTAGSSTPGREWISPRCVLTPKNGVVRVPIFNLGENACGWRRTRGLWKATAIEEKEIELVKEETDSLDVIGAVQPMTVPEIVAPHTWLNDLNINKELSPEERKDLDNLLIKHERCFSQKKGKTHLTEHFIETGDSLPVHSVPYRVSEKERTIIADQVEKMLADGVIRPSSSPWSSPVVLVKKPSKEIRFCIDYRRLNAITLRDVYPLPRVDDILGRLSGARYFTSLDLQKGFWQLPVAAEHQEKTAFVTPDGLYEFLCMPFGLCGAPPSFQRLMDRVLSGLKWSECLCYMDDVLVFGRDFEEHQSRLDKVL